MNENRMLGMEEHDTDLGKIEISPEVIEVIAGIAANEVEGVAAMRGNFASGVVERFGKKAHGKGVKVDLSENGIVLDVFVVVTYNYSIPDVGRQIQDNIREALQNMTALEVNAINIHVVGIQFEQKEETEKIEEL
ncbi:Asp23/Gls24 family envelope stress response protein [Bacillus taeanensis]|uniref:Asp23/Gls24 family envelope stress response protein n=1 Tax=Bacillus taeanensis TaxID=273032 RepID=A0A366XXN1_9BACI|nr:Asp23/Gls24 family envelope stress response protein [Bacillus taeanensis]RBW70657.1 Asp23/Gls24 family envelope stress response protein [Bacillus taeanensis]